MDLSAVSGSLLSLSSIHNRENEIEKEESWNNALDSLVQRLLTKLKYQAEKEIKTKLDGK
jgi:hypothetical protein